MDDRRKPAPLDKDVVKEALQEWLDKQFAQFGKWTFSGLMAGAFVGILYLWLSGKGMIR